MRLANGIVIDKEATFGALKFSALRREIHLQNEDGSVSEEIDYSNKKRLNRTGLWDFIRSRHHKRSKKLMISKGHTYYQSRKLDRVPREAVEELLGITFTDKSN